MNNVLLIYVRTLVPSGVQTKRLPATKKTHNACLQSIAKRQAVIGKANIIQLPDNGSCNPSTKGINQPFARADFKRTLTPHMLGTNVHRILRRHRQRARSGSGRDIAEKAEVPADLLSIS